MWKDLEVYAAGLLALFIMCLDTCAKAAPFDAQGADLYEYTARRIEREDLRNLGEEALLNMTKMLTGLLDKAGRHDKALEVTDKYKRIRGFMMDPMAVGDHEPVQLLLDIYETAVLILGQDVVDKMHLDDIKTLAYVVPVVFWCEDQVSQAEYTIHFNPFIGIVAYWVAYAGCTMGVPLPYSMLCGCAGTAARWAGERWIGPRLAPPAYKASCLNAATPAFYYELDIDGSGESKYGIRRYNGTSSPF